MSPKKRLRHGARLIVAGALLVPVLAACGSDGSSASESSSNGSSSGASRTSSADHDMAGMSDEDMAAMGHDTNAAGDHVVDIELIAYKPGTLEIAAGTTVTWNQMDPGTHTVTAGTVDGGSEVTVHPDDDFDSGELATGESFSQTFDTAGTYPYFCRIHPATMQGEITVR
jgi:plastocyanin